MLDSSTKEYVDHSMGIEVGVRYGALISSKCWWFICGAYAAAQAHHYVELGTTFGTDPFAALFVMDFPLSPRLPPLAAYEAHAHCGLDINRFDSERFTTNRSRGSH